MFLKKFLKRFYLFIFRETGGEEEREGEKYQCVVTPHVLPTGDLAHNPGMCPNQESNWRPFGSLNPLSHTSQGASFSFDLRIKPDFSHCSTRRPPPVVCGSEFQISRHFRDSPSVSLKAFRVFKASLHRVFVAGAPLVLTLTHFGVLAISKFTPIT